MFRDDRRERMVMKSPVRKSCMSDETVVRNKLSEAKGGEGCFVGNEVVVEIEDKEVAES